ncbi:LysR family transcriptional regulator [Achromobacter marplatensis]|jgi:DNA-binding transcriptional LysR family regulator|uniref:DNA-binding transcriptional LysR family regulator n=1 Tax=Achromobacter marplatensis TaxID=470868 RepID=A0ABX9GCY1_9BURK|nr:LysR substrate-binding domain-containing protein [Achromobacter marplatensis]OWT67132.1 LysR family transcriptional regulator [Achromobacter marplatensis]RBP19228.1 DNA-binding transcriptional LysR family regulator [Achromobacter marplatensis]CAB3653658.1 HTH-type transcriptional regulator ArgP [Achromobacter marplatensis]
MRFDLTDLRLFLNVQETGSITAGAKRSHMTLASASERIRGMEDTLGVPLLLREHRGVEPTPAGRTLAHHARVVLAQMDRMRGELDHYGHGLKGHVRVLCNTTALSEYLPSVLGDFLKDHPRVSVDLEERLSHEIADALRAGTCDIGVLADSTDLHGLHTLTFRHDPLTLIVPRGHALAGRPAVMLAEVADEEFVGLVEGSALQEHIAHHARRGGKALSYRVRLRSFDAVCRMVGQGVGIAIVPRVAAVRYGRAAGVARVALADDWATRDLVLCVRDALPAYAAELVAYALRDAPRTTDAPAAEVCADGPGRTRTPTRPRSG